MIKAKWYDIYLLFFLFSVIVSLFSFRNNPRHLRYFAIFLLFTFVLDIGGWYMARMLSMRNHWVYNISTLAEFVFFPWFYIQVLQSTTIKKAARIVMFIYPLCWTASMVLQGWNTFNTYIYVAGALFALFLAIAYFNQLLTPVENYYLLKDPVFWISIGILFYHLGDIPFSGMLNYLNSNHPSVAKNYYIIVKILNILMYFLFSIAFLCRLNLRKL